MEKITERIDDSPCGIAEDAFVMNLTHRFMCAMKCTRIKRVHLNRIEHAIEHVDYPGQKPTINHVYLEMSIKRIEYVIPKSNIIISSSLTSGMETMMFIHNERIYSKKNTTQNNRFE